LHKEKIVRGTRPEVVPQVLVAKGYCVELLWGELEERLVMIYRRTDPQQIRFSCPFEEVSGESLVLTIDREIERLDLRELHQKYSEAGTGCYDPAMLLKVWFFAYCDRTWHCREVAKRVRYDVRHRYFVGWHFPDFRTLNRFRHDHLELLSGYFEAIVTRCEELGLVDASVVALDGTKIRANASGRKLRKQDGLKAAIRQRLEHDVTSDQLPEPVAEAAPAGADVVVGSAKPESPLVSATDPEARLMKTGEGTIRLCYNAQIVVERNQIIVAADVSRDENDKLLLVPLIEQSQGNLESAVGAILTDGGYDSGRNLKYAEASGLDLYWPTAAAAEKGQYLQEMFIYDPELDRYRCPGGEWLTYRGTRQRNGVAIKRYHGEVKRCRGCPCKTACTTSKVRRL
jgi:transposase